MGYTAVNNALPESGSFDYTRNTIFQRHADLLAATNVAYLISVYDFQV